MKVRKNMTPEEEMKIIRLPEKIENLKMKMFKHKFIYLAINTIDTSQELWPLKTSPINSFCYNFLV